ncbi:Lpg1974 family pore-forming outer membrane protein [Adhaeretor mobilis]|nr:Lpg1974 family pore-forming outer membrane protein [Adhaeretor mobilis]
MRTSLARLAIASVVLLGLIAHGTSAEASSPRFRSGLSGGQRTKASSSQQVNSKSAPKPSSVARDMFDDAQADYEPSGVVFATDVDTRTGRQPAPTNAQRSLQNVALAQYYPSSDCTIASDCGNCSDSGYCDMNAGGCDLGSCCDSGCCDNGCCDGGCCGSCCPSDCWWNHRTRVWGEFLYLQPGDADVSHAQQQNGIGGAGTVPFGTIGRVDPDFEPGFRVGADIRMSDCSSVFAAYTHYESAAVGFLDPPVIPGGGGAVGSLIHHPGAAITASVGPVLAAYDIDFQLADFGVRRLWKTGCDYAINWSLGGRYAHLEQSFVQTGIYAGGSAGRINTNSNIDFDGGGVRAGLDGEYRFGCRGFSLYGNVNVSPMIGTVQADYTMRNISTDVLLAQSVWKDDRFITTLDYEAGLAWTSKKGKVRLSAGWNAAHWFNAVTTDSFINGVQNNNYVDIDGALSFSGLSSRIEYRF